MLNLEITTGQRVGATPNQTLDIIPLLQKKFTQIRTILTSCTRNYGNAGNHLKNSCLYSLNMLVEISKAELIDKITILEIKMDKIKNEDRLVNVKRELDILQKLEFETHLKKDLKQVNQLLWEVEDRLRILEKEKNFKEEFITKARMVYILNDMRADIKRTINLETQSNIIEEKSY